MNKLYFLFLLVSFWSSQSQVVNIPDDNFFDRLMLSAPGNPVARNMAGEYFKIDSNNDGQFQISEVQQVTWLYVRGQDIYSLQGIGYFTNMTTLHCDENSIEDLDLTGCVSLQHLYADLNYLETIDVTACPALLSIDVNDNFLTAIDLTNNPLLVSANFDINQISSIDVSQQEALQNFSVDQNILTILDLSNNKNLTSLSCSQNPPLSTIILKNGNNIVPVSFYQCPNLSFICADDAEIPTVMARLATYNLVNCNVNSYCNFDPGADFDEVFCRNSVDTDQNGCSLSDPAFAGLKYVVESASGNSYYFTVGDAARLPLIAGSHIVSALPPPNYSVTPESVTYQFPEQNGPITTDFCLTPNGNFYDLDVTIVPLDPARPGFDSNYRIVFKNKGPVSMSGTVSMAFQDALLDFVSASVPPSTIAAGTLTWAFSNLNSYQTETIDVVMNVNSPMETPAVNIGDQLSFAMTITPMDADEVPFDNMFGLKQIVVGSMDPNDKTCLEGNVVGPEIAGQYVHYLIRFENTGTFAAENIVVKDLIDTAKFDVSTLEPVHASHAFETRITNGNQAEFIFEAINLPFEDNVNDGYVVFKIRTLPSLIAGDTFSNSASIYFDYNFPIITNTAMSTIQFLDTPESDFSDLIYVHPNPAREQLQISMPMGVDILELTVMDAIGRIVLQPIHEQMDISALIPGTYFLQVSSTSGKFVKRFIKL